MREKDVSHFFLFYKSSVLTNTKLQMLKMTLKMTLCFFICSAMSRFIYYILYTGTSRTHWLKTFESKENLNRPSFNYYRNFQCLSNTKKIRTVTVSDTPRGLYCITMSKNERNVIIFGESGKFITLNVSTKLIKILINQEVEKVH